MLEVIVTPEQLSADGDSRDAEDSQREGVIVRCAHRTLDLWLLNCSSESLGLEADPLADLLHDSQISEITSLKERQAHRGERKPFQKVFTGGAQHGPRDEYIVGGPWLWPPYRPKPVSDGARLTIG